MINYMINFNQKTAYELGEYISAENINFDKISSVEELETKIITIMDIKHLIFINITRQSKAYELANNICNTIGILNICSAVDIFSPENITYYTNYTLVGTINDDKSNVGKTIGQIFANNVANRERQSVELSGKILTPTELKEKYFQKLHELTKSQRDYINSKLKEMIKNGDNRVYIRYDELPDHEHYTIKDLIELVMHESICAGWYCKKLPKTGCFNDVIIKENE